MSDNKMSYDIEITVVSKKGTCGAGHEVGDIFLISGETANFNCQGLCISALYSMMPKIIAMRYGAQFPWDKDNPDVTLHACPDALNPMVFQLRRIRD